MSSIAAALTVALTAGLGALAVPLWSAPAAATTAITAPAVSVAGSGAEPAAADLAAAVELAAQAGEAVEIAELTTQTERQLANPDGTITYEQYLVPQRVRKPAGWVPVDTGLRVSAGRVVPQATALDMSFSAGGTAELVTLTEGAARLGLSWPAPLPAPVLSGDTATYPEVLPGVDLVVRAEPDSFAQMLVVKTRQAASNPALARVAWRVSTAGLSLRLAESGAVQAVDHTGEVVFVSPASLMWDSPPPLDAAQRELFAEMGELEDRNREASPGTVVDMPVEVTGTELAVRPDLALLADPTTTFPVWIDPPFSKTAMNWAPVNKSDPNRSYPSGTSWPRDTVRVGKTWGEPSVWRSHFRFDIEVMAGQNLVSNPTFRIELEHSASCNATPVQLWRTNTIGSGSVTWNSMSDKWLTLLQERSASANKGSCPQPNVIMEFSNSTLRERLQSAMNSSNATFTFGLRAKSESDDYQWKRFKPGTARLVATYNLPPATPTALAVTTDCYQSCSSPAMLRTRRPTLRARVTDPNSDKMTVAFEVRNADRSAVVASSGTAVSNVSSGASPTWLTPTLPQEQQFHFRVRAQDQHNAWGPWSGYFTFFVDTNPPPAPTVSSAFYQHKDTGTWNGGPGQSGSFTFGPSSANDVVTYKWRFLNGTESSVNVSKGASHTRSITPPSDLEQVLQVQSIDHAGNISPWVSYAFLVRPQPVDVGYWKFDEGAGAAAVATDGGTAYAGVLQGGAGWAASGINPGNPQASGGAVSLNGSSGYVEMPPVLATDHAAGFSVSAWVNATSLTSYRTVVAQDGQIAYAFRLYYRPDSDQWCFGVRDGDPLASSALITCSAVTPQTDVWTHLVGVYDRANQKIRIYVNGGPNNPFGGGDVAEANAPVLWAATGSFTVGRSKSSASGNPSDFWHGRIDEVRAYQRVLDADDDAQIVEMYLSCVLATCPPANP